MSGVLGSILGLNNKGECMKRATWIVVSCCALAACDLGPEGGDLTTAAVQNIGINPASGTPPLGDGVAPVVGMPGDGAAVVTQIGGWSGGPGAVKWHGGQWVMPYDVHLGSSLQNVSCDVLPRADATDLIELVSSNGQVLGSNTVPATTASVIIRLWIVLAAGHVINDGEQLVLRHSPRSVATGAWTNAGQDLTVISCAVNAAPATSTRTIKLSAIGGTSIGAGGFQTVPATGLTGNWYPVNDGDILGVRLPVRAGDHIDSVTASVYGNTAYTVQMSVMAQDDALHAAAPMGTTPTSTAQNTVQSIVAAPDETVTTTTRDYFVQFRAHRLGSGDGGSLFVGPIAMVTSSPVAN